MDAGRTPVQLKFTICPLEEQEAWVIKFLIVLVTMRDWNQVIDNFCLLSEVSEKSIFQSYFWNV